MLAVGQARSGVVYHCFDPKVTLSMAESDPWSMAKTLEQRQWLRTIDKPLTKKLMEVRGLPVRLKTRLMTLDRAYREASDCRRTITSTQILVAFARYYQADTETYIQAAWKPWKGSRSSTV